MQELIALARVDLEIFDRLWNGHSAGSIFQALVGPGLKPSQAQVGGFVQVGTGITGDNQTQADNAALRAAFGLK